MNEIRRNAMPKYVDGVASEILAPLAYERAGHREEICIGSSFTRLAKITSPAFAVTRCRSLPRLSSLKSRTGRRVQNWDLRAELEINPTEAQGLAIAAAREQRASKLENSTAFAA